MADVIGMTTVTFGFIAIASSFVMSISPVPFFWRILKTKNTEEFHPYPFIASFISHLFWIIYCYNAENYPFTINCFVLCCCIGLTFDCVYVHMFVTFTNHRMQSIMACIFITGLLLIPWGFGPLCYNLDAPARRVLLGTIGVVSGTLMHLSPLSNIIHVYKTKSSKYMPFGRCITMFLNSICWFIFTCLKQSFNPYIAITNGLGILLGIVSLGIYYKFYETPQTSHAVKHLEATLDVDPREEIVVLNRICPRCKYIMFESKEKIKLSRAMNYVLYQNEGSKSWRVNAVATTDRLESYKGVSDRFDKLSSGCGQIHVPASNQTNGADQV